MLSFKKLPFIVKNKRKCYSFCGRKEVVMPRLSFWRNVWDSRPTALHPADHFVFIKNEQLGYGVCVMRDAQPLFFLLKFPNQNGGDNDVLLRRNVLRFGGMPQKMLPREVFQQKATATAPHIW